MRTISKSKLLEPASMNKGGHNELPTRPKPETPPPSQSCQLKVYEREGINLSSIKDLKEDDIVVARVMNNSNIYKLNNELIEAVRKKVEEIVECEYPTKVIIEIKRLPVSPNYYGDKVKLGLYEYDYALSFKVK